MIHQSFGKIKMFSKKFTNLSYYKKLVDIFLTNSTRHLYNHTQTDAKQIKKLPITRKLFLAES